MRVTSFEGYRGFRHFGLDAQGRDYTDPNYDITTDSSASINRGRAPSPAPSSGWTTLGYFTAAVVIGYALLNKPK